MHGVATRENLTGEAELLRQGMGAPFVNNQGGKYLNGATPANVKNYYAHPANDPSKTVVMKSPVEVLHVGEKNPSGDDIDAMMLNALGGQKAISASQNSNYQGNYETAVGQKAEQSFDMSDKIATVTKNKPLQIDNTLP